MNAYTLVESGLVPDQLLRRGIRRLLRRRQQEISAGDCEAQQARYSELIEELRASPIAVNTQDSRAQHYEVPAEFFQLVLGPHAKYSSCLYPTGKESLGEAEAAMLEMTCQRAGLQDGQQVLELGCGWGSLTLWMAEHYPASRIVGVSHSHSQRQHILGKAKERGLTNLEIRTADMNDFTCDERFDRIVSVEMFEHMRNYQELLSRVRGWLRDDGRLFVHIFVHRAHPYLFLDQDDSDWMARYFFTGGIMPSHDLLLNFADDFAIERHWKVNGRHYQQTSEHWLQNLDRHKDQVTPILTATYGAGNEKLWMTRWRLFFLAVAELFGYLGGDEWWVAHYRFRPRGGAR